MCRKKEQLILLLLAMGSTKAAVAKAIAAFFVFQILGAPTQVLADAPVTVDTVAIPAGKFVMGSDRAERELAYLMDEVAYGHRVTREQRWYESEADQALLTTGAYRISRTPVTNAEYALFIAATGHPVPDVDKATWDGYGLIHPWERSRRHAWQTGVPPVGREQHPVVLVSRDDARAYAKWLSRQTGQRWQLPTEAQWEKAARGVDGRHFPWGDNFDRTLLNSHDAGPFDTVTVGSFPAGASTTGLLDAAGQVFEWTSTALGEGRSIVKGGSWDDSGCGVCRPAARHGRPDGIKHILIGFRVVAEEIK